MTAFARVAVLALPPLIGLLTTLGVLWIKGEFRAQNKEIAIQTQVSQNEARAAVAKVETVERVAQTAIEQSRDVNNRLISVETKQAEERIAAERFQSEVRQQKAVRLFKSRTVSRTILDAPLMFSWRHT